MIQWRFMKRVVIMALCIMNYELCISQNFCFDEMTYSPKKTTFQLFAPNNAKCSVTVGKRKVPMSRVGDRLWRAVVMGDQKGQSYTFNTGHGDTPGVFAKAVTINGQKGVVVDLAETNPEGWELDKRPVVESPADLVIYEMHHRDFSIDDSSGLENKGKFLALTEPKAIAHLKELGVNAIHILPSYDYGSVDEMRIDPDLYYEYAYEELPEGVMPARLDFSPQYNWGYDPVNYNVPEDSYSTDPFDPLCSIREFKQMVQALHKAGIRVILDVVYNHTYDIAHSNFQKTYPDYYYRAYPQPLPKAGESGQKDAEEVTDSPSFGEGMGWAYSNGSGCGNETASEKPMMRRFMIESVKYWINEYHIDGFRFDLMGCHDIETMNQIRKAVDAIDPTIFIYGEGWSAGPCALPTEQLGVKANVPKMPRIAAFSDELRDALRGPFSDDTKGAFLAGIPGEEESVKFGIAGAISHPQVDMSKVNYAKEPWATEPTQMISYVSCHDDMCLVDRLKASYLKASSNREKLEGSLIKLDLLAQTAVFTSQGVPFLLSGEEMLRDKKGVHNSFNSPDSINRLDWNNLQRYPQVFDYYKNLIALRKHHPMFRLGTADLVRKHLEFLPTADCLVAYRLTAPQQGRGKDSWGSAIIILNANAESRVVEIPQGEYTIVCQNGKIDEQGLGIVQGGKVTVAPQSALILHD